MTKKLTIKIEKVDNINTSLLRLIAGKKIVIFSSHLDDAVLSCGGLISYLVKQGSTIEVCSVFTDITDGSSESITTILKRAGFKDSFSYIKARKKEDENALNFLGVKNITYLDFIDGAWRSDENGNHLYPSSQVGTVLETENELREKVVSKLRAYVSQFKNSVFLAPLARGNHVDHQIVRDAVSKVISDVIYYEDFPYSGKFDNQDEFISNRKLIKHTWSSDLEEKRDAILLYKTQEESFRVFLDGSFNLSTETYYSK